MQEDIDTPGDGSSRNEESLLSWPDLYANVCICASLLANISIGGVLLAVAICLHAFVFLVCMYVCMYVCALVCMYAQKIQQAFKWSNTYQHLRFVRCVHIIMYTYTYAYTHT